MPGPRAGVESRVDAMRAVGGGGTPRLANAAHSKCADKGAADSLAAVNKDMSCNLPLQKMGNPSPTSSCKLDSGVVNAAFRALAGCVRGSQPMLTGIAW